jgi:trehalose-6-phosphate synthase
VELLEQALNLSMVEKTQRMEQTYEYIQRLSTLKWAHNFLVDMKRSYDPVGSYVKTGFGLNWQLIKSKRGFKALEA